MNLFSLPVCTIEKYSLGPNSLIDSFSSVELLLNYEGGRVLPLCHYYDEVYFLESKEMVKANRW